MPITSMVELYQENEQARERFKALASPFSSLECSLFAVMLTSRSLESHSKLFGRSTSQVTPEDWAAFEDAITHFDDVVHILRVLPISMLLVFRSVMAPGLFCVPVGQIPIPVVAPSLFQLLQ